MTSTTQMSEDNQASIGFIVGCLLLSLSIPAFLYWARLDDTRQARLFSNGHLCRAAVSVIMGRPAYIIKINQETARFVTVSYNRPSDGSLWQQKCMFEGERIIWGAIDGRWRDNPAWDEYITYREEPETKALIINQRFSDGSVTSDTFHKGDFQ